MPYGRDTSWVIDPPDVSGAGEDEWARMSGVTIAHPLVGGPGWGPDSLGTQADSGYARVVDTAVGMPGGAPPQRGVRAAMDNWKELFNPSSPMFWLLLFALGAASLAHFRLSARVGR